MDEGGKMTTIITLDSLSPFLLLAVNGIFTGLGAALGSWIANKGIIHRTQKLMKHIKKKRVKIK